jgi:restriction system protein
MTVPKYDEMFNPLLRAIHNLGGSASNTELEEEVAKILRLSNSDINEIHRGNQTKFSYRLAWSRNYLKRYGLLENSARGVWALTQKGNKVKSVDKDQVNRLVKTIDKTEMNILKLEESDEVEPIWKEELLNTIKSMKPPAFERLCQRLLRESGFTQVEITGRSGDGGIDGKGVVKIGGLLSFHVIFQCKRYSGSISPSTVRDFRGAMVGRADKGIIITTGTFTRDAKLEAQRDGAVPIDLIDGVELVEKLKELSLGMRIEIEKLEKVEINKDWYSNL